MEDWKKDNIQKIFNLGRGRVISQTEVENTLGVYPVYSSQSQNNGEMGRINTYDFDGDYVTWTTDGAYAGTVFFRTGKFNCTNVCGTLKAIDEKTINHQFFAYLFSVVSKKYVSYVGNPKLMNGVVAKIPLFYPTLVDEQRKIAEILSTVDKVIEQTEELIAKYRHIKQGLMQDLLTYGIDVKGNIRNPKTHKFETKNGILVPSEWEVDNIGDCADVNTGSKNTQDKVDNGVYPFFVRSQNIERINTYNYDCEAILTAGDGVGVGKIYHYINGKFDLHQRVYIINNIKPDVLGKFLFVYFRENFFQKISMQSAKTTVDSVRMKMITHMKLPIPSIEEQIHITNILFEKENIITKEEESLTKYKKIKQGLMHDLLTGKKRVKL